MERIYSAFFTSDRRRSSDVSDVELTAEALAQHDQETRQRHGVGESSSGHPRALSPERTNGTNVAKSPNDYDADRNRMADILEPTRAAPNRSFHTNSSAVVVVGDDLSALGVEDPTVGIPPLDGNGADDASATLARHRRELGRLVKEQYAVSGDLVAAARAAARAFLMAYGAKAFTALLLASRKWGSSEYGGYADAVRLLLRADTIRFGAFFGSLVGVFRLTELAARLARGGQKDATNLALAGGVSGLALLVDSEERRSTIALYVFVRMLDVVGRHLTAIGTIPSWQYSSEILFALSNVPIMYGLIADPTVLPKSYYNWILHMGGVTDHGLDYVVRQGWRGETDAEGNPIGFRGCQPHYHVESCMTHSAKEWFGGLGRAIRIYLPVHFLPAIIFKFPRLQGAPVTTTARISYAALCSSVFLTTYQTIVKLVVCTMRNTFQHDYVIESYLGGLCTGVSLFFEDPKRRFELMLYCAPRAIDIIRQLLKRRGFVRYVKHGEVALFCLSMSLIMSRPPEHFKPTYLSILRFLFGRNTI